MIGNQETVDKINEDGVSIIVGARNEYPQVVMTICSLMEDMHACGITKWEIILMDNGSIDETSRFFTWKPESKGGSKLYPHLGDRWAYSFSPRGLVYENRLRIFFDPVMSNVGTRNKGVEHAKYKNIIFSDAHISVRIGTIYYMLETLSKFGGCIHAPVSWMGASSFRPEPGMQYSYKVGEKIWGTWNKAKVADTAFFIPQCGHCFLAVDKKQFQDFRGYPYAQRVYGGGEPYLDTKYWMLGSHAMMEPRALVYHLSAGRGYSWNNVDLIHNMFLVSYILGGEPWLDRIYITYLNKPGVNQAFLEFLRNEAVQEGEEDKAFLDQNKVYSFEEVLGLHFSRKVHQMSKSDLQELNEEWFCKTCTKRGLPDWHVIRLWDKKNQELHGNHRSWVQEFELTRDSDGRVFIGRTPIIDDNALAVASKYV